MRYQVRWSNGYWKTFDTKQYQDVDIHDTKREAEYCVGKLNRPGRYH